MSRFPHRAVTAVLLVATVVVNELVVLGVALAQDSFFEVYRSQYIVPRAFPDSSISDSLRSRAYRAYVDAQVGLGHVQPTWSDSALDTGPETGPCLWHSAGPTNINGRVTGVAYDPERPDRIFATTVGGIWRSLDGGRKWHRVSDNLHLMDAAPPAIWSCIAVNPINPHEVFAGSGDPNFGVSIYTSGRDSSAGQGIWRSRDDGDPNSWVKVSPPQLDGIVVFRLRISPNAPNDVYAATSTGVWVGTHATMGSTMTWSRLGLLDAECSDVVVDFGATLRLYAGVCKGKGDFHKGLWKWDASLPATTTTGNWHERMGGIHNEPIGAINLAMDPSNASVVFAKIARSDDGSHHGLYRAINAGQPSGPSWSYLSAGDALDDSDFPGSTDSYCWYNNVVEIDPSHPTRLLAGGKYLYLSNDGGDSWTQVSNGGSGAFAHLHDDQHAIAFHPTSSDALIGNDGGLYRSVNLPDPGATTSDWHWEHISHGMTTGQYFALASTHEIATALAAGAQDNCNAETFGNRTWYKVNDCDSWSIAMDSQNACFLYETYNGQLAGRSNLVEGSAGSGGVVTFVPPNNVKLLPPSAADPAMPLHAICAGMNSTSKRHRVCQTVDGVHWTETSGPIPSGMRISCLAVDPSSSFGRFYAGMRGPSSATIWSGSGTSWIQDPTGLPTDKSPNAIVVDARWSPKHVYAALGGNSGGALALSTNDGLDWQVLGVGGISSLGPVMGLTIDPSDQNTLYAATMVGVLKGTFQPGATPTIQWAPFGDNLPDGADVSGIWVNPVTKILNISTMGYGLFKRDITPNADCRAASILVRDNVYDSGVTPSPSGEPDPERPVQITGTPFFQPDPNAPVQWWASTDIRVEVPGSGVPAQNAVPLPGAVASTPVAPGEPLRVDHVEVESCPVVHASCPAGTMIDTRAIRGTQALVHVQVTNQGHVPLSNVRVLALWADAGAGLPLLPADLWSSRFPVSSTGCPAWAADPVWHAVDPSQPCVRIAAVSPDLPEVATFVWDVPSWAGTHSCMVAIVEAQNDPIDPAIRASNEQRLWVLVPNERHVTQRNLHIIDLSTTGAPLEPLITLQFWNPTQDSSGIDLVVSRSGLSPAQELCVYLPSMKGVKYQGAKPCVEKSGKVDWTRPLWPGKTRIGEVFAITAKQAVFSDLRVPTGRVWTIGLRFGSPPRGKAGKAGWCTALARRGETILGGSTYVLRPAPRPLKSPIRPKSKNVTTPGKGRR